MCFQGSLGNVQRTYWGRPLDVRLGRSLDVRFRRPRDASSGRPRDGQIGSLGDVLEKLEEDVLGTLWGLIFVGWVLG